MDIEKAICKMRKTELEAEKKSRKKERFRVNINPNSLFGKEIKYQTAILHYILEDLREQNQLLREQNRLLRERR